MRIGPKMIQLGRWRVELCCPTITLTFRPKFEFLLGFDTVISFRVDRRHGLYVGGGFNILGFGLGIDYFKERK